VTNARSSVLIFRGQVGSAAPPGSSDRPPDLTLGPELPGLADAREKEPYDHDPYS
jgi:hypothetical protein